MNIKIIPKDEVVKDSYSTDVHTVKDLIENVRKRRKCNSKYTSEYRKRKAACRNNNLDPNGKVGIGYITEVLVAKKLGIKTCFDITGNFNYPGYDMLEHKDMGKINVKGSILTYSGNNVHHFFSINKNKKADFFFFIGYDYEMKNIICVYAIPNDDYVSTLSGITIPYDSNSKWNEFKESESETDEWNNTFHTLELKNCPVLRKNKKSE